MAVPTSPRRALLAVAVAVLVLASGLGVLWMVQRQFIYFPDSDRVPPAADVIAGARDVALRTSDGLELGAWFVPARAQADLGLAVLLAPGNGGNRSSRAGLARALSERGLAVLLLDYRGYGGNPGRPSEGGLAADAVAASEALEELGYPPERTIYLGESLGTGVVAALSARRPPAGIALRSPFTALADVGAHHYPFLPVRLLLRDRFEVRDHIAATGVPVTVVYAEHDSVVPSVLSARVADAAEEAGVLAERLVVPDADHNDPVMFGATVADAVLRLAREVSR